MSPDEASTRIKLKIGLITLLGLVMIGAVTIYVNDTPMWWRSCQLVHINVEDASGLKQKSPIKSLGIEIGYLRNVDLNETFVTLGICLTAPVEVLPTTRAYIRSEGFLGDKFVELKPIKFVGKNQTAFLSHLFESEALAEESAEAATPPSPKSQREIPMGESSQDIQHLVNRVDQLVHEITGLTSNLKQAINPEELRTTMRQLNRTLENASKTLAPEGGLNQTAQRSLAKLEDAIEQLRDIMTRVNKGEGSVGMLLNDPVYAEQIKEAIANLNRLLSKVSGINFVVDMGGELINGYSSGRGWFRLAIWPKPTRYYLLGITIDPRGHLDQFTTTTTAGNVTTTTQTSQVNQNGLLFTAMLGIVFWHRLDLALGALNGDGTGSINLWLGPHDREDWLIIKNDVYSRIGSGNLDLRTAVVLKPFSILYARAGLESVHQLDGHTQFSYGAGISFTDEDIKVLFALR